MNFDEAKKERLEQAMVRFDLEEDDPILPFISKTLDEFRQARDQEIVEKLEGMKKTNKYAYGPEYEGGATEALQDAINELKK